MTKFSPCMLIIDNRLLIFNILAYGDASDTSGANHSAKPSGRNTLSQLYKPLTHLMPYLDPFENKNKLQDLLRSKLEICTHDSDGFYVYFPGSHVGSRCGHADEPSVGGTPQAYGN